MDSNSNRLNYRIDVVGVHQTDIPRRWLGNLNHNRTNDNLLVNNPLKFTTMATMMKSNDTAILAMQQMLQERCIAEPSFALKMANPSKSMEGAVNYLCSQIQKSGLCVVDDTTVMNLLVHYFDENEIEEGGKVNCNIVVGKPELSEEDKANLKEQAMEQYKEEQLRELRRQSQPKATAPKHTTAPKAGAEINVQPNLFGDDF